MCCGWKVISQSLQTATFGRENRLISHFWNNKYNNSIENSPSVFIHLISLYSLQNIYRIGEVESTNSMSQEIGPVTPHLPRVVHHQCLEVILKKKTFFKLVVQTHDLGHITKAMLATAQHNHLSICPLTISYIIFNISCHGSASRQIK